MGHLLHILTDDAAGKHDAAERAFQELRAAQAAHPRLRQEAINRALVQSCKRMGHDRVAEMLEQITEAKAALDMAESALWGIGCEVDERTAQSLMNEAIGYLTEDKS